MRIGTKQRRVHVVLPSELIEEIDARVGPRNRSRFIQDALEEKLNRPQRVEALERAVEANPDGGIPEWETRESTAEWVRALREEWKSVHPEYLVDPSQESPLVCAMLPPDRRMPMAVDPKIKIRRVHVVLPDELIEAIDALVGQRRRSQFIAETVAEELRRRRLHAALDEMAGSLADVDIPGWETREAAAAWVRALRDGDEVPPPSESAV
jgi:metal-responsive CopG/Arc/MetJ family transcriptional regulator